MDERKERSASLPVSIIVPLHNSAAHVDEIASLLKAQTIGDFQAILVDDGSTDHTLEAARAAIGDDPRFLLLEQANAGPGVARNTGMAAAQGDYLAFMDADDCVAPDYLESLHKAACEADADIGICQMRLLDVATGAEFSSPDRWPAEFLPASFAPAEYADDLFGTFRNWPVDKLFRRSFVEREGLRFPALYRTEDLAFTCAALASAQRIALVDKELYTYRVNNPQSSTSTRHTAPLDFLTSCLALKRFLDERGLMERYRRSYTQWAGLCCVLNLAEMGPRSTFQEIWRALHTYGLEQLGLCAPREKAQPFHRQSAAGLVEDDDVEAALCAIERHGAVLGARKLRKVMDEATLRGPDGLQRIKEQNYLYPAGRR